MAELIPVSANIRLTNEDRRSICFVSNVSPTVTADTAAGFVSAIEKLYNRGLCPYEFAGQKSSVKKRVKLSVKQAS